MTALQARDFNNLNRVKCFLCNAEGCFHIRARSRCDKKKFQGASGLMIVTTFPLLKDYPA